MLTKFLFLKSIYCLLSFPVQWCILILFHQRCKSWWRQPRKGPKMDLRKPKLRWRKDVPSSKPNHSLKVRKNTPFWNNCLSTCWNKIYRSLFREEVIVFWRWGVGTLYWGGLFQCWASVQSSTRWSHAATGTMFLHLLHLHDSCNLP